MLIANMIVLLIVIASAAYQYLKGSFVRAFFTIIATVIAAAVAFGYFEALANIFISKGDESKFQSIAPWASTQGYLRWGE